MTFKIIKAIKLYNKVNKAYKASKKLIDSKKDLNKDVDKAIETLKADLENLVVLLPDYKEALIELKEIIKDAF
ncbi:hypothetical protein [Faecalibacillus faecis]|uniref:hypothetical protein n=1 Tax=Faecalibacillus faecis TaxID=1982628 RepID=UPI00386D9081